MELSAALFTANFQIGSWLYSGELEPEGGKVAIGSPEFSQCWQVLMVGFSRPTDPKTNPAPEVRYLLTNPEGEQRWQTEGEIMEAINNLSCYPVKVVKPEESDAGAVGNVEA